MKVTIPRLIFQKFLKSSLKVVVGDANFFIPTTRFGKSFSFSLHQEKFLDPFIECCGLVYVHTSVYSEILNPQIKQYIDKHPKIMVVDETRMSDIGRMSFETIEDAVANYTDYKPDNGCYDDEGEVKSISYAASNNIEFFITHDDNAIRLLENEHLHKFTGEVQAITLYEIIYYLSKKSDDKKELRNMYRFLYHGTKNEQAINPSWSEFIAQCENEYHSFF